MKEQNEKRSIEEMANILEQAKIDANATIGSMNNGFGMWYAKACYNAGYRKQIDGEWIFEHEYYGKMLCSNCNGEALVNECSEYVDSDFCPNCGAKMKGGERYGK